MSEDPRVEIVVEIMRRTRIERARRMIEVRDMRRRDGRVLMIEEAREIITALDKYDAGLWDAMLAVTEADIAKAEGRS